MDKINIPEFVKKNAGSRDESKEVWENPLFDEQHAEVFLNSFVFNEEFVPDFYIKKTSNQNGLLSIYELIFEVLSSIGDEIIEFYQLKEEPVFEKVYLSDIEWENKSGKNIMKLGVKAEFNHEKKENSIQQ